MASVNQATSGNRVNIGSWGSNGEGLSIETGKIANNDVLQLSDGLMG